MKAETKLKRRLENLKKLADGILEKKNLTGKDIGRLDNINNIYIYLQQTSSAARAESVFTPETFEELGTIIAELPEFPHDESEYNEAIDVYTWARTASGEMKKQTHQAGLELEILKHYMKASICSFDSMRFRDKLPLVLSEQQYKEELKNAHDKVFLDEETKQPKRMSLFSFILLAIYDTTHGLEKKSAWQSELSYIMREYNGKKIDSPYILKNYNRLLKSGYYTLPDGTRSDMMALEDWREKAEPGLTEEIKYRRAHKGKPSPKAEKLILQNLSLRNKILSAGGTEEQLNKAIEENAIKAGLWLPTEFHLYTEPPRDMAKRSVIATKHIMEALYPALQNNSDATAAERKEQYEDLCKTFGKAFFFTAEHIEKDFRDIIKMADGSPLSADIKDLSPEAFSSCYLLLSDIYAENAFHSKEFYDNKALLSMNPQAVDNGLAIKKDVQIIKKDVSGFSFGYFGFKSTRDFSGFYSFPKMNNSFPEDTLEGFLPGKKERERNIQTVSNALRWLKVGIFFLRTFNTALSIISKNYDMPELLEFSETDNLEALESGVNYYNELLFSLLFMLRGDRFNDPLYLAESNRYSFTTKGENPEESHYFSVLGLTGKTEQEQKKLDAELKALTDYFPPIDLEEEGLKPVRETMNEIRKATKNNKPFDKNSMLAAIYKLSPELFF